MCGRTTIIELETNRPDNPSSIEDRELPMMISHVSWKLKRGLRFKRPEKRGRLANI